MQEILLPKRESSGRNQIPEKRRASRRHHRGTFLRNRHWKQNHAKAATASSAVIRRIGGLLCDESAVGTTVEKTLERGRDGGKISLPRKADVDERRIRRDAGKRAGKVPNRGMDWLSQNSQAATNNGRQKENKWCSNSRTRNKPGRAAQQSPTAPFECSPCNSSNLPLRERFQRKRNL
jgi:hypothetical protein